MIDTNVHILPLLDNGVNTLEKTVELARLAVKADITHVVLTPHTLDDEYDNSVDDILRAKTEIEAALKEARVDLTVAAGQELRLQPKVINLVRNNDYLTLDEAGKYILLDVGDDPLSAMSSQIIFEIVQHGLTPIIAGIETNAQLQRDTQTIFRLVSTHNVAIQISVGALLGHRGRRAKQLATAMVKNGLGHLIASDSTAEVPEFANLYKGYQKLRKIGGDELVSMYRQNVENVYFGRPLQRMAAYSIK
jgi:protein-tyrosine phosphatase